MVLGIRRTVTPQQLEAMKAVFIGPVNGRRKLMRHKTYGAYHSRAQERVLFEMAPCGVAGQLRSSDTLDRLLHRSTVINIRAATATACKPEREAPG